MKIYLAGPIFTLGDKFRNDYFYDEIKKRFPFAEIYDPLKNTDINGVEGKKKFAGSKQIADADNARLDNTDILIACIDGDVLPAGTCCEIGKFHEKIKRGDHKYIIGVCTDNRQCFLTHSDAKDAGGKESLGEQQYSYQNLYVTGIIKDAGFLVSSIDEVNEVLDCLKDEFYTPPKEEEKAYAKDVIGMSKEELSKWMDGLNEQEIKEAITYNLKRLSGMLKDVMGGFDVSVSIEKDGERYDAR